MNGLPSANDGFTLLEILVAMAVFAVMASMAYAGLHAVLDTRQATEARAESLAQWQRFVYTLNEDLAQALPRAVRDELGSEQPAFSGGNTETLLSLTRSVPDWLGTPRGGLQRVAYQRAPDGIYRQVWTVLDRTQQSRFRRRKLLAAERVDLRFYGTEWTSLWVASGGDMLPRAVEASVQVPGIGEIRRVFMLQP